MEIILPNNNNTRRSVSCKTAHTSFTPTQLTERNSSSRPSIASLTVHSELLPDGYTLNDSWGLLVSEHASYKCTFSHSSLTVGRGLECDVVVNDPRVSNHHFTITLEREIVIERQRLPAINLQETMQKETNSKRTLEKNAICCKNVIRTDKNKNFLPITAHLGCNSFVEQSEQEKEENESEHVHLLHKIVMRVLLEDHSTNGTYVNDLRIGRGRRCELKNGDDIAIVLLPEKRSRRSDDSLTNSKMSNNDDGKDEERLGEQNNRVGDNSKTNNNACFNTFSDKSQNRLPSNQGDAYERTKPRNKNNENQSEVEIANRRESKVKWISDIADERTYLERFCFHLYPKENAVEMKSNQSFASVHVDSSTVSSANSGNVCINSIMSPLCIDHYESASHILNKLISHDKIDSNKVKEDNIITDKANNTSHVSPSHPLSMPGAIRMNGKDKDLVVQQQQQQQQRKRGQNWFNDVRDNFIAPQRASSRLRDVSPAVLSSSSLVASTLGRLTPLLTPANNNQANLASNVVNYSIMPRRPLQWGPCIGSGASGKVHLGIDVTSSKLVAIKVLKGTRLSSKSQERNSMSSLRTNSSNSYSSSNNNINNNNYSSSYNNNNNNNNDDNDRNEQERKRVKTGESRCLSDDQQVIAMYEEEQYSCRNDINEDNSKENSISSSSNSCNERSKSSSNSDSSSILSISNISVTNTHDSDDENDNKNAVNVEELEAKILYENKAEMFHANSSESNTNTAHCKNSKEQVHYGCKRHDGCAHGFDESSDVESNTDITNVLTPAHVRELWMLTRLQNHRVVRCLGFQYEEEKGLCIMMEYVAGGTLQSLIKSFGVFEENVIRMYTLQILEGLEYLEQNEVVHGDLKSSNVLVSERGNVKLTDFGTSHILRDVNLQAKESEHHTSTHGDNNEDKDNFSVSIESNSNNTRGKTKSQWKHVMCNGDVLCGTPLYMSPELIRTQISTHASDVWALGCVVFEMATGGILPWREVHHLGAHSIIYHIGSHVDSGPSLTDLYLTRASHLEATHHGMESCMSGKRQQPPPTWRRSDTSVEEEENEEEQEHEEEQEESEKCKHVPHTMYKRKVEEEEEEQEEERKVQQNQFLEEQHELYRRQLSQSKLREVKLMHEKMLPAENKSMEIYPEELTPSITLIDFIQSMLTMDSNTRPKASELLHHPFILGENTTEALLRWHEYCAMQRTEEEVHKEYDNNNSVETILPSNVVEIQRATCSIESDENNNNIIISSNNNNKEINSKALCNDNPLSTCSDFANGTNNFNNRNNNCSLDILTNDFGSSKTQEKVSKLNNSELNNISNDDTTAQWHDECHTDSTCNVMGNNDYTLCNNDVLEDNKSNVLVDNEKEHINFEEEDNNEMTESQKSQPLITAPALALTRTNLQWHDNNIKNETWKLKNFSSPSLTSVAQSSPCICYKMETHSDSSGPNIESSDLKDTNAHEYYNSNNKCTYLEEKREMKQNTLLNDTSNNELHNSSHHRSSITPLSLAPSTNDDNDSEKCQNNTNSNINCISRSNLVENNTENENDSKAINLQSFGRLYTNYANNNNIKNSSNNNRPVYTEEWPSVTANKPFQSTLRSHQQYLRRHEQERRWMEMSNHQINTNNNNSYWHDYNNCKQKYYKGQEHYNEQYVHHQNYHYRSSFATCKDDDNINKAKLQSNTNTTYNDDRNNSYYMTNYTNKRYKNNTPYYTPPTSIIAMNTINPSENINEAPVNLITAGNNENYRENKVSGNAGVDAMTKNELTSCNQVGNRNINVKHKGKVMDQENKDNLLLCNSNVLQTSTNFETEQTISPFTNTNSNNDNYTSTYFSTHSPPSYNAHNKPFGKSTFQNLSWQQEHFMPCNSNVNNNKNNNNNRKKCKMKDCSDQDQLHRAFSGNCIEKNNKLFSCMDKAVNNNMRRWSNRELGAKGETSDKSYQTASSPATTTIKNNSYTNTVASEERNVTNLNKTKISFNDYKNTKLNKNSKYHNKYISARKNVNNQVGHMDSTKVKRNRQQRQCKTSNKSGLTSEFAHLFSSPEVLASSGSNRINVTRQRKYNKLKANTENNNKTATVNTVTPLDIYEECNLELCDKLDAETCTSKGDNGDDAQSQLITNTKLPSNKNSYACDDCDDE